jgi:hypothetical protein
MAKKKKAEASRKAGLHKEIDETTTDPFERAARVQTETSNDGRFSTYEVAPKKDPRDGDLILQYRGAPTQEKR